MTALGLAKWSFLLFAFALFWMKDPLIVGGLPVFPSDLLFLLAALLWLAACFTGEAKLRWSDGFWPLLVYLGALSISAVFSTDPRTSAFKLATQAYLVAIPVLTYQLLETRDDLKQVFRAYIAGGVIVAAIGVGTLLLFPFLGHDSILDWPLHHYGTLPPGPYPRLEVTFEYPAMMANYLALALMLVILSADAGWIGKRMAQIIGAAMLATALFALTPGFGGLLVMLGLWTWHSHRGESLGRVSLIAAIGLVLVEILVAAVTPILHRTAPFLIAVPGLPQLAPAVRLLAWIDAGRNFLAHPLVGLGIGVDPARVPFVNPVEAFGIVTDAHNMPLSIAAQGGVVGLVGMTTIVVYALRQMRRRGDLVFGLALAFLSGLVVQGLVGSFEDARHLWLAYGLMLVVKRLVPDAGFEPATFGLQNRCSTN